jgi:transposase-like protein
LVAPPSSSREAPPSATWGADAGYVEQDHRRIKRLVRPGLGFKSFHTARWTIAGDAIMARGRKGQVSTVVSNAMPAQAAFRAALFDVAA